MRAYKLGLPHWRFLVSTSIVALVAFACERQPTATIEEGATRLVVSPEQARVRPDDSLDFSAVAYDGKDQPADVNVTWQSSSGSIQASAQQSDKVHWGRYKSAKCGTDGIYTDTVIAVARPGKASDTAYVTIDCPDSAAVATVTVAPAAAAVNVGGTVQLSATLKDADGNSLSGREITWSSASPGVATVNASGLVSGVAAGSATITATSEGKSGSAAITVAVAAVPVASVTVAPASATVNVGATVQLSATPKDANGNTLTGRSISWSSNNTSRATVSSSGLVTGVSAGSVTITATSEGKSGSAAITVQTPAPAPVATVAVAPATATVNVGATVQLTATLKDANGNTLTGRSISWSSNNSSAAGVNSSGLVTGVAAGAATITATSEGKSGTAAITVQSGSGGGGTSVVLVGAGDIATDGSDDEATAKLLDAVVAQNPTATVFNAGDNAYPDGSSSDYSNYYQPTWGRHKARTRPSPGNHEYHTSGASGYFNYFGSLAGPSGRGYYSYDIGDWHIVSLNSEVSMSAGSAQETWLKADLAASSKRCTLAYWHKPRFSSGSHGNYTSTGPLWNALYAAGAEVIVVGHDHNYERFAPQTPAGARNDATGIRQFVVGTGGTSLRSFSSTVANSEVRNSNTHGVIKFTLSATGYTWEFIPISGSNFRDSGSGTCH